MTRVLLYADNHGKLIEIPKSHRNNETVIILAGDFCPNNVENFRPGIMQNGQFTETSWRHAWNFRKIDIEAESKFQNNWIETKLMPHLVANSIDTSRVLVLNGNHDWCFTDHYFSLGLRSGSKTILFDGKKIGLIVGVNPINGEWYEEISDDEFNNRIKQVDKDIDILITHSAPSGILDEGYGNRSLYYALMGRSVFADIPPHFEKLRYHFFGHSHNEHGKREFEFGDGRILKCYNAATNRFILEI